MTNDEEMSPDRRARPARIRLQRRIERSDVDAGGTISWMTVFRLAEAAEAELHTSLGIERFTFGATPRVAIDFEFRAPAQFNDVVDIALAVERLGRSSIRYAVVVSGAHGVVAEGQITACLIDRDSGKAASWPDDVRQLLTTSGEQRV
jgi:acyl-CoA thioester hydrolase